MRFSWHAGDRHPRYGKNATAYRRARACPSPCAGLRSKRLWTLGCGRFSVWRGDRGGQAPALRSKRRFSCGSNTRGGQAPALQKKTPRLTVGRGPVPRHAPVFAANVCGLWVADVSRFGGEIAGDRPPRYVPSDVFRVNRTIAGDRPPHYGKKRHPLTVGRGPVPRRAPVFAANVRGLWAADVFRFGGEIAGDRPPRYVPSDVFRVNRTIAGDRPPHYGKKRHPLTVGRGPVPRRAPVLTANVRGLWAAGVSRFGGEIAGDRPPRYVPSDVFRVNRTIAGDRPPHYEKRGFRSGL